jgi:hypothetical protein
VKETFTERTSLALLYKLEKTTIELVSIQKQMMKLIEKFEQINIIQKKWHFCQKLQEIKNRQEIKD